MYALHHLNLFMVLDCSSGLTARSLRKITSRVFEDNAECSKRRTYRNKITSRIISEVRQKQSLDSLSEISP